MQTLINYLATTPLGSNASHDDGRDKWVGIVSVVGFAVLAASDLISLFLR